MTAAARFPDPTTVGGVDVGGAASGLARGLDDDEDDCADVDAAFAAADARAALADCGVVAGADFLDDGVGRAFDCWDACVTGGGGAGVAVFW